MAQAQTTEVVESVRFYYMTEQEVRKHSFLKVTNHILLDNLGRPVPGGLYDPVMGPLDDRTACKTCGQLRLICPGHCGHIELVYPIYHPLLFNLLYKLLQRTCFFCHHFKAKPNEVERIVSQLKLIIKGDIVSANQLQLQSESGSTPTKSENSEVSCESGVTIDSSQECEDSDMKKQRWTSLQSAEVTAILESFMRLTSKKCNKCGAKNPKLEKPIFGWVRMKGMTASDIGANVIRGLEVKKSTSTVDFDDSGIDALSEVEDSDEEKREKSTEVSEVFEEHKDHSKGDLLPSEVREILKDLWKNEHEFCSLIGYLRQSGSEKIDHSMFFLESVLVPPTKFRPPTKGGESVMEHPETVGLYRVIVANINLGIACTKKLDQSKVISRWMSLQQSVNDLFDSKTATVQSQEDVSGICGLLEKKEGLFRPKMGDKVTPIRRKMGKRVNPSRSVISPDP